MPPSIAGAAVTPRDCVCTFASHPIGNWMINQEKQSLYAWLLKYVSCTQFLCQKVILDHWISCTQVDNDIVIMNNYEQWAREKICIS